MKDIKELSKQSNYFEIKYGSHELIKKQKIAITMSGMSGKWSRPDPLQINVSITTMPVLVGDGYMKIVWRIVSRTVVGMIVIVLYNYLN